jgi:hypothetical protein
MLFMIVCISEDIFPSELSRSKSDFKQSISFLTDFLFKLATLISTGYSQQPNNNMGFFDALLAALRD